MFSASLSAILLLKASFCSDHINDSLCGDNNTTLELQSEQNAYNLTFAHLSFLQPHIDSTL